MKRYIIISYLFFSIISLKAMIITPANVEDEDKLKSVFFHNTTNKDFHVTAKFNYSAHLIAYHPFGLHDATSTSVTISLPTTKLILSHKKNIIFPETISKYGSIWSAEYAVWLKKIIVENSTQRIIFLIPQTKNLKHYCGTTLAIELKEQDDTWLINLKPAKKN